MPNGFESFAQNAIALGDKWRERRQTKKLATAMGQFDTDPNAAVQGVTAVDPVMGYNMRRQIVSDAQATETAHRTAATETLKTVTGLLRPAVEMPGANPDSIGRAYDAVVPMLSQMGMKPPEIAQWKNMVVSNPSMLQELDDKLQVVPPGAAVTRGGHEVYRNALAPKTMQVRRGDGGYDVITIDPNTGHPMVGGSAPAGPGVPPAPPPARGFTTPAQAWGFTGKAEGGYSSADANGQPVNHGVNAQYYKPLPGFPADVKDLTPEQAQEYYNQKYFQPSGAANMPPALGVLHADTYYINPTRAKQFLDESKGDPQEYLRLRAQWQDNLVRNNPKRYGKYAEAWDSRNQALAQQIASGGGGASADAGGGGSPGAIYSTPGKPAPPAKPGSAFLTDQEVADAGLDPNVKWQRNHLGDVVMVGPAAQLKNEKDAGKGSQQFDITQNALGRMKTLATALLSHPGLERASGTNSYFPSIHGGQASNFESALDSLKAQIGLAIYQNQKQSSPTGSAGMRMTNFELQQMQRDISSLDLKQDPATLKTNIQKVITYADTMLTANQRARDLQQSRNAPAKGGIAAPPREAIDMLRSNPSPQRRQQFDQIFGQGAAAKFVATRKNNFSEKMPIGQTTPYGTRY